MRTTIDKLSVSEDHGGLGPALDNRVTRLETQMSSLAASVTQLAETVGETNHAVNEIKSIISSSGKMDGRSMITIGGGIIAAFATLGALFLGPIQRDVDWMSREVRSVETGLDKHEASDFHDKTGILFEALKGDVRMLDMRLKSIEQKSLQLFEKEGIR